MVRLARAAGEEGLEVRTALGVGFGVAILVATLYGLVRWTRRGAEEWYVGERVGAAV